MDPPSPFGGVAAPECGPAVGPPTFQVEQRRTPRVDRLIEMRPGGRSAPLRVKPSPNAMLISQVIRPLVMGGRTEYFCRTYSSSASFDFFHYPSSYPFPSLFLSRTIRVDLRHHGLRG